MALNSIDPEYNLDEASERSNDEFIGDEWSIKTINNTYIFEYLSGALQGQLKTIEISSEDNQLLREGKIGLDDVCIKYNVF